MAQLAYLLEGEKQPEPWETIWNRGRGYCHFAYPGSTQGIRVRNCGQAKLQNIACADTVGGRALLVESAGNTEGDFCEVYRKTYYEPKDFSDNRYCPAFSPTVYPGQTVHGRIRPAPEGDGEKVKWKAGLYARVRDAQGERYLYGEVCTWEDGGFHTISWKIPGESGFTVLEIGIRCRLPRKDTGLIVDELYTDGKADYRIDFAQERTEKWTDIHREISQFTREKGLSYLEEGRLHLTGCDFGEIYTGDWEWSDYEAEWVLTPVLGEEHYALIRVQGAMRSYAVGFTGEGRFGIRKKDHDSKILREIPFVWKRDETYRFLVRVQGNRIRVFADGQELLSVQDDKNPWLTGGIGLGVRNNSHCICDEIRLICY